jgi:mycothiol synthase
MNVRAATEEDLGAIRLLLVEDEEHLLGRPSRIESSDLREWLSQTELASDSVLFEEGEELCAFGWCIPPPGADAVIAIGVVHPRWKGRGLGGALADRLEQRSRELGRRRMHANALAHDEAARPLFEQRGYREIRRFYEMAIELDAPPATSGVQIETLSEGEERAFHDALDEAFQDHWEHTSSEFEEWWARHSGHAGFDRSLWFLIRADGEIAAVSRNEANRNGGGYVGALGVRRQHRGKGSRRHSCCTPFASSTIAACRA